MFLSGGLDSSIVAALAQQEAQKAGVRLKTFSVGMKGATDLKAARKVATWINSDHYEVVFSEKDMLDAIPRVIKRIESYDITTVRASTGMVLLSDYIRKNTQVKVVFSGEGADELSASYRYFRNAPSPQALQDESVRLVQDLQYFDILRCDKSVSGSGLEARTPFFDMQWVDWYMRLPPTLKSSHHQIEKKIIRDAFHQTGLLPQEILQRGKEAFSDGCSSMKNHGLKLFKTIVNNLFPTRSFKKGAASTLTSLRKPKKHIGTGQYLKNSTLGELRLYPTCGFLGGQKKGIPLPVYFNCDFFLHSKEV